jgi:DNA invertase Pin-like site-specific DNA recombinase
LLAAALAEQRRRGKNIPVSDNSLRKPLLKVDAPALPQGKLNAIRAAFKAGFTPSRIARQFRISQSDVKKALASDEMKR